MKFDRNILEKLIETNAEAYSLLHYQYTALESRHAVLENEYRETVRRIQESGLVDPSVFNEVKSAYSQAAILLAEAQQEMENLRQMLKEAQKKQQTAEYEASLYKPLVGESFYDQMNEANNDPMY